MNVPDERIFLSAIDEQRFGIKTARISEMTFDRIPAIMEFCSSNKVVLLIARCPASDIQTVQAVEKLGFNLMDTLVYYSRKIPGSPVESYNKQILVRPFKKEDENSVITIARQAFRGYPGHYHADTRLERSKCDQVYVSWIQNSCSSQDKDHEVLVSEFDGIISGFLTLKLNRPDESEVGLFCVDHSFRGRGVSNALMIQGVKWSIDQKTQRILISTQIINVASQTVWIRCGFNPSHAYYTFHKWFD